MNHYRIAFGLSAVLMLTIQGCAATGPASPTAVQPAAATSAALTLHGYNYTNRYIDQFSVNGQGGGNLFVSTPTAGGGGSVCCVGRNAATLLPREVTVRWAASACLQRRQSSSGQVFWPTRHTFKERKVLLTDPVPLAPKYFKVHIYPDDRVEVAITDIYSPPRLVLEAAREDRSDYPRCRDE